MPECALFKHTVFSNNFKIFELQPSNVIHRQKILEPQHKAIVVKKNLKMSQESASQRTTSAHLTLANCIVLLALLEVLNALL